ncbi:unnamed protein product [Citrullus colocynthis]|uniref:Uncharacterized protein n=1 Tax=Citrullus colocynthis TaxID=252529 RepID=A0ABP0YTY7_9ROSI
MLLFNSLYSYETREAISNCNNCYRHRAMVPSFLGAKAVRLDDQIRLISGAWSPDIREWGLFHRRDSLLHI